ncbi:MAG TPA: fatty acid desaturase [Pirellulaceae bacterium]|nr:fatty acid desaturase [Pirellulaceae bacterium]
MDTAQLEVTPAPAQHNLEMKPDSLALPAAAQPVRLDWNYVLPVAGIHLLSLLIFVPWYFSWSGVVIAIFGFPLYGMLGITLCYHRILTHRGATLAKWLEHCFAILGVCCLQDSPARWVAVHRLHHRHSDEQPDPHSPLVSFFWAHMGWVLVHNREHDRFKFYEQYARDVLRDPFYMGLERNLMWFWVYAAHAALYFAAGFATGWLWSGQWVAGLQLGASWLVWGVFFRTVFVWHATWAVNSLTHVMGYRNYETKDDSRNHWLVAIVAYGEGWHNNHHADQRAAAHGHKWWEYDMTYAVIRLLEALGLAKDVVRPRVWRERVATAACEQAAIRVESEPEFVQSSVDRRS